MERVVSSCTEFGFWDLVERHQLDIIAMSWSVWDDAESSKVVGAKAM